MSIQNRRPLTEDSPAHDDFWNPDVLKIVNTRSPQMRQTFEKVKSVLGFEPKYTIQEGIEELVDAMHNHVFDHVEESRNFFGNYEINYPIQS